ncbi:MAG: preprotein translocase subunit SecG [Gemmatimonadetes bacterium]|nr:MAG: preprotein translocase subunit SecG [Gemmatimonadota bacterium]
MVYTFLLTLLVVDGLILTAVVLLQAGQGGGLASLGGGTTDLVMGGRQAVTILHKTSWISGGLFMFLAVLLSITASRGRTGESEVQRRLRQQVPAQQQVPAAPLQTAPITGTTGTTGTTGAAPAPAPAPAPVPPPKP